MRTNNASGRAHGIDALRGLAATGVVIVHSAYIYPFGVSFYWWNVDYFSMGVALFFVVSAFSMSIAYPLGVRRANLKYYALRRFFRIAPLFYVILLAWNLLYLNSTNDQILKNITFTFSLWPDTQVSLVPAGWSIGVEVLFYLAFPIVCYWRGLWKSGLILLAALVGCELFNRQTVSEQDYYYWTNIFTNAPYFAFGILAWSLFQVIAVEHRRRIGLVCLFGGLALMSAMFEYGPALNLKSLPVSVWLVLGWGAAFSLLVLSQALYPIGLLVNPLTLFLGKISYSLYLMHPLFIYGSKITPWAAALTDNPAFVVPVVAAVTLAATIPIAYLLYVLVEAPFIRLGRRMTRVSVSLPVAAEA